MAKAGKIVSFCLFIGTLVTGIVGFCSTWWYVEYVWRREGLWLVCVENMIMSRTCDTSGSVTYTGNPGSDAVQAMMFLGLIAAIADLVLYILVFKKEFDVRIAGGVCGLLGLFVLISIAIYASMCRPPSDSGHWQVHAFNNYCWGFKVTCTSGAMGIINAILTFIMTVIMGRSGYEPIPDNQVATQS